ncbi:sigma-70 family RNA polymerase sigma factor [Acidovorax sp. NPDC077693]|uniref:sigma-70 family RNA polymerase sigma factor n=1 Tax=unclassified Acidovorax TaxID=2684926 RepID=UPI0037CBE2B3
MYSKHHGWLFGWLRARMGCTHNAADVAQDTFVRIIASRDALTGMREPRAYLTTTAKRLLVDRARRQQVEQAYLAELAHAAGAATGHHSPEDTLMAVQALVQISTALQGTPAKAREAFVLHYLDGESHASVAARLGVSDRMVRRYLVQVLLQCRANGAPV